MHLLLVHSNELIVEAKSKTKLAVELSKELEKQSMKDCLVCFSAFSSEDDLSFEGVSVNAVKEIESVAKQIKTKNIFLYPYVHLLFGKKPSKPVTAINALNKMQSLLQEKGFTVKQAPFGWYKAFKLDVKGHPLAELSRVIEVTTKKEVKVKERKKGSEFFKFILMDVDGTEYEVTKENWRDSEFWKKNKGKENYDRLRVFVRNELEGHKGKEKPRHIKFMQELELVDYCPESDLGHMKWYPKGLLIKDLILAFQEKLARSYGAFKIQNPLLYRLSNKYIKALLGEFHEKDYSWSESNDNFILRFASDPGAFPFMQKLSFSYKIMPVKEYEEAICFRKELSGELTGIRRVRNFVMTDLHAFCKDEKQVREEFEKLCFICKDLMDSIISKGRWVFGWEGVFDFYLVNKQWLQDLIKKMQVPAFFKLMKERSHYYSLKNEFQSIEADEANNQISTVQLDVVNGERFNINFIDEDGKKKPCLIIHCSTFGSIERTLCAVLENAAVDEQKGIPPILPLWLSPTQVRLIPVSEKKHLSYCKELAERISRENIRVDIDDRSESVGKRIRFSEIEWVPFTLVVGEKEIASKKFNVRVRQTSKIEIMTVEELIELIKKQITGFPFKPLPLPELLSKRPIFFG